MDKSFFPLLREWGVGVGGNIYLSREGVTTVFSDPRILIVRCCSVKVYFYIISAHAPYCKSAGDGAVACEW